MKHFFTLIAICLLQTHSTFIQDEKTDLELLCSGKWNMEYMTMGGERIELPTDEEQASWMIFHKNGKHEIMSFGDKFKAKWEYKSKGRIILMIDKDGTMEQKIEKLTETELLLSYDLNGTTEKIGLKK